VTVAPAAVIFDLDETLFDHRGAATAAVGSWARSHGAQPDDALVALWFELEERFVRAWHRGEYAFLEQRRERIARMLEVIGAASGDSDDELDRAYAGYLEHYEAGWRRFEDVEDALVAVSAAGLPTAVLTNGSEHQQHHKVAAIGLTGRIGPVLCCDALGHAKPDPRSFLMACERLGVAPERTLHVGDRHDLDVVAAREAGLDAVHLDRDGRGPLSEPDRITTLRDLGPFLD
jgi:putative hydrolase of the HAD superfamily